MHRIEKKKIRARIEKWQTCTPPSPDVQGRITGASWERWTGTWTWTPNPLREAPVSLKGGRVGAWPSGSSSDSPLDSWTSSFANPNKPAILLRKPILKGRVNESEKHREQDGEAVWSTLQKRSTRKKKNGKLKEDLWR